MLPGRVSVDAARGSSGSSAEQLVADLQAAGRRPLHPARRRHRPDGGARSAAGRHRRRHVERRLRRHSPQAARRARGTTGADGDRLRSGSGLAIARRRGRRVARELPRSASIRASMPGASRSRDAIEPRLRRRRRATPSSATASVTVYFDPLSRRPDVAASASCRIAARRSPPTPLRSGAIDRRAGAATAASIGPDLERRRRRSPAARSRRRDRPARRRDVPRLSGRLRARASRTWPTVDPRIAAPRRATPRMAVPAGSVAIAAGRPASIPTSRPAAGTSSAARRSCRSIRPAPTPFAVHAWRSRPLSFDRRARVRRARVGERVAER